MGRRRTLERPGTIFGLNRPTILAALRFCANQAYKRQNPRLSRLSPSVEENKNKAGTWTHVEVEARRRKAR